MADSDDEDLKRAIALSLEEASSPSPQRNVKTAIIDLVSSDDDEDDLDAPVITHSRASQLSSMSNKQTEKIVNPQSNSILNSYNRKQEEEERLARVKQRNKTLGVEKRKASTSPPSMHERPQAKAPRINSNPGDLSMKMEYHAEERLIASHNTGDELKLKGDDVVARNESSIAKAIPRTSVDPRWAPPTPGQGDVAGSGIQFPHGTVKKTWAMGCPRQDDIKVEEVLQKNTLKSAVLGAFQIDPDWIQSKILDNTQVTWVVQAKTEFEKMNWQSLAPKNFHFCFPSMQGNINCMHSKLQLLAHPTHLRIVIPSANLTPYDWGENGGVVENVVFLIDLPRLPTGKTMSDEQLTPFAKELLHFLKAMGLDATKVESLRKFDFSNTSHLALIHSIGGSHFGTDMQRTGYCGLGKFVKDLGLDTQEPLEVDFVTASIGSLDDRFLRSMYLAAQGDSGLKEYKWRTEKPLKSKGDTLMERKLSDEIEHRFRIYFPSKQTVLESKGGMDAAGTICFQSKWYEATTFPKSLMRDCQSRRKGLLMHNKMIFVRSKKSKQQQEFSRPVAWAYIGSANLSESAWGRVVKDQATKQPKLNCRNWECGVLFSVPVDQDLDTPTRTPQPGVPSMNVFDGFIPVPMINPGTKFESKLPWFYNEKQ